MGIDDRDYMRERTRKRLKGLDEMPERTGLEIQFDDDDKTQTSLTKQQKTLIGGAGVIAAAFLLFVGMDFLLIPSESAIVSEKARQKRLRESWKDNRGPGNEAAPSPAMNRPTYYLTADQLEPIDAESPMQSVNITGNGVIRLVDMTGSRDYKVLRLRSLYNPKLVGIVAVGPGEMIGIKVPYEHPFRVTAITTPAMPRQWDNIPTSTVTVDLGTVSAMPNKPGVIAMGAPDQQMRVISNDRF